MSDRHSLLDTITDSLAPVHRDGHKFVAIGLVATLLLFWIWPPAGWVAALITAWVIYFFRDPDRVTPLRDGLIIAPGDGPHLSYRTRAPPGRAGSRHRRAHSRFHFPVGLRRSHPARPACGPHHPLDLHPGHIPQCRSRQGERGERAPHHRHRECSRRSRRRRADRRACGPPHRHLRSRGRNIGAGERFGLIRFGSRVDTYLPVGATALVAVGQRAIGGETVFADLKSTEAEREARRH